MAHLPDICREISIELHMITPVVGDYPVANNIEDLEDN